MGGYKIVIGYIAVGLVIGAILGVAITFAIMSAMAPEGEVVKKKEILPFTKEYYVEELKQCKEKKLMRLAQKKI